MAEGDSAHGGWGAERRAKAGHASVSYPGSEERGNKEQLTNHRLYVGLDWPRECDCGQGRGFLKVHGNGNIESVCPNGMRCGGVTKGPWELGRTIFYISEQAEQHI